MIRKGLKVLGWTVLSVLGLFVAAYVIAVAVNWKDREPSIHAKRFEASYAQRPKVDDEENAYIYVVGFEAPRDGDPQKLGMRRIAWMKEAAAAKDWNTARDPGYSNSKLGEDRLPIVREFFDACRSAWKDCRPAFDKSTAELQTIISSEQWLVDRYMHLVAKQGWLETAPLELEAPLPSYGKVMEGQRLLLANAMLLARAKKLEQVGGLLSKDLAFWRMVLASSDILISKMIAAAAINSHLHMGNLIMREVESSAQDAAIPEQWRLPISNTERSMLRCLAGEWVFSSSAVRSMAQEGGALGLSVGEQTWPSRIASVLLTPMFEVQDTINGSAEYLAELAELSNGPIEQYPARLAKAEQLAQSMQDKSFPPKSLYNIVGNILHGISAPAFIPYASRVADLEGTRRAVMAAATLRADGVAASEVARALESSEFRNPYTNERFTWDDKEHAIVFSGLEQGERRVHPIYY